MNIITQKIRTVYNIFCHLWRNRVVISNPLICSRLFMERTDGKFSAALRFGSQRFVARKEDMNAVTEVLVGGGYDTMLPFLKGIPHAPVILDCGANIGSFALRVLNERPDARIVSVEAAQDTYGVLSGNQQASKAAWDTVHAALWSSDGNLVLSRSVNSVMHTVREASATDRDTIPSRSLPSIRKQFGLDKVDILKMDIEGAETTVIPSAPEAMEAGMVIIEIHKLLGDPTECCRILSERYPFVYVCPEHEYAPEFPNVVYYLYKEKVEGKGMIQVDLMDHLRSVYDPEKWRV